MATSACAGASSCAALSELLMVSSVDACLSFGSALSEMLLAVSGKSALGRRSLEVVASSLWGCLRADCRRPLAQVWPCWW